MGAANCIRSLVLSKYKPILARNCKISDISSKMVRHQTKLRCQDITKKDSTSQIAFNTGAAQSISKNSKALRQRSMSWL